MSQELVPTLLEESEPLTFITRIPQELLSEIFLLVSDAGRYRFGPWKPWDGEETIITVTHVCRRWRTIALEMPVLWSHISLSKFEFRVGQLKRYLTRSASLPLTVLLEYEHNGLGLNPRIVELMNDEGHSERITTLWIYASGLFDDSCYCPLNVTNLESLILHLSIPTLAYKALLRTELSLPCLRHLALIKVRHPEAILERKYFQNIRSLIYVDSPENYTIRLLLETLQICSNLQILQLDGFEGTFSYRRDEQPDVVHLPHLKLLKTSTGVEQITYLLNFLKVPEASWNINCVFSSSFALKLIPQNVPNVQSAQRIRIEIGRTYVEVSVDSRAKLSAHTSGARSRYVAFVDGCFRQLCTLIPSKLPLVPELHFAFSEEYTTLPTPTVWVALIRKVVDLEVLRLEIIDVLPDEPPIDLQNGILACLKLVFEDIQVSKRFPSLKILELVGFDFGDSFGEFNDSILNAFAACGDVHNKIDVRLTRNKNLDKSMVTRLEAFASVSVKPEILM